MTIYPAHIRTLDNGERVVQSCEEHSRSSADIASHILRALHLEKTAYLAALLHDMGKFKSEFRSYIERVTDGIEVSRGSVKHTFCGVRYLFENYHDESDPYACMTCELIAYAVGAHHGLFDSINEFHESGFLHRICNDVPGDDEAVAAFLELCADKGELDRLFSESKAEISELTDPDASAFATIERGDECNFYLGLLARLITSAVIEGDRRDTAEFMNDAVFPSDAERDLWLDLLERVETKLEKFPTDTPINRARRAISDECRAASTCGNGVYRLNVPTGGGKTLASLRFALAHAAENGKRRIIFTSPLLSILDQNSKVIREMIEDDSLILEHHSNVARSVNEEAETERNLHLIENWSAPIIITTLVQLLNTMFDGKSSSVRRFSALCDAVIIIDEVQSVPHKLLTLFNLTVSFLADVCSTTVVLCSATQPCCEKLAHPIRSNGGDIVVPSAELSNVFRRTVIEYGGKMQLADVPSFAKAVLESVDSLLIVCNTKQESSELFERLCDTGYDVFHLSAAMCMAHRQSETDAIYASLAKADGTKTVCVSTQVIEAGVDISFGAVIRFTAGMDSIVQAAGRCNRHGESKTLGRVFAVQIDDEDLRNLSEISEARKATADLIERYEKCPGNYESDLSSDSAIRHYYRALFQDRDAAYFDYVTESNYTLFSLLSENSSWMPEKELPMKFSLLQAFKSAGDMFSVFDSDTTDVVVRYSDGDFIADELLSDRAKYDKAYAKELLDRAGKYTVSLYNTSIAKLCESGAIAPALDGTCLILDRPYYDEHIGVKTTLKKEDYSKCTLIL